MKEKTEQTESRHQTMNKPEAKILFGKYEMGKTIGRGTFAKVYHGTNLATQESVAIKVMKTEQVKKQGLMEQIKREISVMRLVRHPNIVQLKEVMASKTKIFFIMEYIQGGELFAKITEGRVTEDLARKYFRQLISAVDFCHSRGVYHRDLKPENLLLDENGDLKVSDFGLSALRDEGDSQGLLHTRCGTPAYVAPEILRKRGYDGAKSDVWSCGVVLFVLICGYLPFDDENVMKMYRKIFTAEFRFPPWVSIEVKRLISRVLVTDPEKRISVSSIMRTSWFRKGILKNFRYADENIQKLLPESESTPPPFYNAFEFISSMSSGFDLSNFFENGSKSRSMFTSKFSAYEVVKRIEVVGRKLNFGVSSGKDYKVKMERRVEGRKGRLEVTAEVYEVAAEVTVVEISKGAGDTVEYKKIYEEDVRPALKDIVWSWQGESNGGGC